MFIGKAKPLLANAKTKNINALQTAYDLINDMDVDSDEIVEVK